MTDHFERFVLTELSVMGSQLQYIIKLLEGRKEEDGSNTKTD